MMTKIQHISIFEIVPNPNNPRIIKDKQFKKLVESITNFPDMLEKKPIVINEHKNNNITIGK